MGLLMSDFIAEDIKLFGASVSSVTISSGLNTQSTTAQLTLVFEDDGPLASEDLEQNFPPLGSCVGFKIGDLEFAGILQRYTQKLELSGYVWDVTLESASKVLDGVQVILDEFMGTNFPGLSLFNNPVIRNVWNPYGYRENYNSAGSLGIFGGSNRNSLGFPAVDLLNLMQLFSTQESFFGRKPKFGVSEYELDLGPLIERAMMFQDLRVSGQSQTALSIISEITSLALCDFIVSIKPKSGDYINGVIPDPVIYLKLIDRSFTPDPGMIKRIAREYEQRGLLVSADVGKELNDTVTQRVVIGAPATRYVQADRSMYKQAWGKSKFGNQDYVPYIVLDNATPYFLDPYFPFLELRAAGHSFDSWLLFHVLKMHLSNIYDSLDEEYKRKINNQTIILGGRPFNRGVFVNPVILPFIQDIFNITLFKPSGVSTILGGVKPLDYINTNFQAPPISLTVLESIYNSVRNAYEEYYGSKFAVYLPVEPGGKQNNVKFERESQTYVSTWEISESAWNEKFPYSDVMFYDDTGKMKAACEWIFDPRFSDYSALGTNYNVEAGRISSVINIDKDIYFPNNNEAYCIATTPSVYVFDNYTTENDGFAVMVNAIFAIPYKELVWFYGFSPYHLMPPYGIAPAKITPQLVGVPQVSNRYNWGPWYSSEADNGRAELIFDQTLAPETFGSINNMNSVGDYYARVIDSNIAGVDSGFIELAEYPKGNIGDRFFVSGPYVTSIDISLSTSGYKTTYKFNTWTPEFGKLSKQNIDRLTTLNKTIIKYKNNTSSFLFKKLNFPKGSIPFTNSPLRSQKDYSFKKTTKNLTKRIAMAIYGPDPGDPQKPFFKNPNPRIAIDDVWQQGYDRNVGPKKLAAIRQQERNEARNGKGAPRLGYTSFSGKKPPPPPPEPPEDNP